VVFQLGADSKQGLGADSIFMFFNLLLNYSGLSCAKFGIRSKFDQVLEASVGHNQIKKKNSIQKIQ
jgi:hypothetical protein